MSEFKSDRAKNLDLVLCKPREDVPKKPLTFAQYAIQHEIDLTRDDQHVLDGLPLFPRVEVSTVLMALEAKACMTAHSKAIPRLYDELNSSHLAAHGAADFAIAAGFAMINNSREFISPARNKFDLRSGAAVVSHHDQPAATEKTINALSRIPRRNHDDEVGYDAFGILVIDMKNDLSPVRIVNAPPAPSSSSVFNYESLVSRICDRYNVKFRSI